jgi:beta-galactosidase
MKIFKSVFLWSALTLCALPVLAATEPARIVIDFGAQWKFLQSDLAHGEEPSLDDSSWRPVSVPHDWSIAGPVDAANPSSHGGGYFPTGVAWYRKRFTLPAEDAQRPATIVFDGVMANSDVWINGYHLGHRPNGYVSFFYDLSSHLQYGPGATNLLAVRCDTSRQPASRWYEGGGIYRPVRLVLLDRVHLEPSSTFLTSTAITATQATVRAQSTVVNESAGPQTTFLEVVLTSPSGHPAGSILTPAQTIAPGAKADFSAEISVASTQLWDLDHPALYRAQVRVLTAAGAGQRPLLHDEEQIRIGIRSFRFDPATGFWLNGRNMKLQGVALHADGGALGIAIPTSLWERRLTQLRSLGVNAIRTAHNPPSPEFLDLCDRMGFLVMDELFDSWTVGKNPYDYHLDFQKWAETDARDTVRRDRNHPSVILWSAGNEIHDTANAELAHGILARLIAVFHGNDSTRPVTQALFRPNVTHDYDNGLADMLDVVGQNYRENEILAAHEQKPTRAILGTENTHERAPWLALRDHPAYAGQFLWTGVDYLGEAGQWPQISRPYGLIDRAGFPHPRAWERQSWWSTVPAVHLARRVALSEKAAIDPGYEAVPPAVREPLLLDWSPRNTARHSEAVEVYSNCDAVELFLNGRSLGRQKKHPDATPLTWSVPFEAGSLRAVAYMQGRPAAEDELRTAGKPARILLTTDRSQLSPDRNDIAIVTASAVDEAGVPVPDAPIEVQFTVSGAAEIVATDNGDYSEHPSFLLTHRALHAGRAIAILRATASVGSIEVRAEAPGLKPGAARITAIAANPVDPPAF